MCTREIDQTLYGTVQCFSNECINASPRRMESPAMPHSRNHAHAITCPHGWVPIRRSLRPGRAETYNIAGSCAHGMISGRVYPVDLARRAKTALGFVAHIPEVAKSIHMRFQV